MTVNGKKTYKELIQEMKNMGIHFNDDSESDASEVLRHRNYYLKLQSYLSNFKQVDGQYDIEFAALADISNIDTTLRRYLTDVAYNVEQALKVRVNDTLRTNPLIDEIKIVEKFRNFDPYNCKQIETRLKNMAYDKKSYADYKEQPTIWPLVHVMTWGQLDVFISFLQDNYPTKKMGMIANQMKHAKNIRNAVSHSNPILIDLFMDHMYVKSPMQSVVSTAHKMGVAKISLHDRRIHDLVALFGLHEGLTSRVTRWHIRQDGREVIKRMESHDAYYHDSPDLQHFKIELMKLIEFQIKSKV